MNHMAASPVTFFGAQTNMGQQLSCNLFLLCPNNSGSTYLSKAMGTSPNIWSLSREGQHALGFVGPITQRDNALIWAADKASLDRIVDPAIFNWSQNKKTWYFQAQAHSADARVFFTKAPPFLAYAEMLKQNFANTRFLIMVRNPYAVIEAIVRRRGPGTTDLDALLHIATRHILACLEMQRENQRRYRGISTFFTYEDMCAEPIRIADQIKAHVPEIKELNLDQKLLVKHDYNERLRNMNDEQISRLTQAQLEAINALMEPHQSLLAHFGYELITRAR
ncbi:sulfotransferase [Planktotalea sp.]|uniref:sulfotransferase n=1 Tax=Planktotalea sp. TaxID=2029877 RepID=UPI003D6BBFF4